MAEYRPRIVDAELTERLGYSGAVLIEGARACGKTETARRHAGSTAFFDEPQTQRAAELDPTLVLGGDTPRLLDEWQLVPAIWNAVRREVDNRQSGGQFILTGSATPADDLTRHSGAGRFSRLRMRPMSLVESGDSTGAVSLSALLAGESDVGAATNLTINDLAELACRGGWPGGLDYGITAAMGRVRDYIAEISRADVPALDDKRRDPVRVQAVLSAVARNVATEAGPNTLARDAGTLMGTAQLRVETVSTYLSALERLMVLEFQPHWGPHLRSRSTVRSSPKLHFVDPSLALAALRAGPADLRKDVEFFGLVFESLVIRDLRVYAQGFRGEVRHYRDSTGLEVDAIVTAGADRWAAFEVKLGASPAITDSAAAKLLKFADRVDTQRSGAPAALVVVTGTGYGYRRPDGVLVVPIGALGP